jgi:hypothetical protein
MKSSFELLWDWGRKKMNLDEQISKRVDKGYRFELWNENVIRFPDQNTLKTYTKQIRNPLK